MIKIENKQFNETYYEETLDNGLNVIVWHKPDFMTSSCIFATPYGSLDLEQVDEEGKHYQFPSGIAHFLEHKLFESDHGDVMSDFSKMGANVNAFTSYTETCYYFDTSAKDIDAPLNLLLDFVQDLAITDASVEKEKGIINQELSMYLQMPDSRLVFETFKSMYKNHPLKYDIGGSEDTVNTVTKKLLEDCYAINYHPSNMMVVVVSPLDPMHIFDIIKTNQEKKTFKEGIKVKRYVAKEPLEVVREENTIIMDVNDTKACVGIKLPVVEESDAARVKRDWALKFALENYFTTLNPDYQKWIDSKQITAYFGYEEDLGKDYAMILFYDETQDPKAFKEFVVAQFKKCQNIQIAERSLTQLKNRNIGEIMRLMNKPEEISVQYFKNSLLGVSLFENVSIVEKLTIQDCYTVLQQLDISNLCETIIKKD